MNRMRYLPIAFVAFLVISFLMTTDMTCQGCGDDEPCEDTLVIEGAEDTVEVEADDTCYSYSYYEPPVVPSFVKKLIKDSEWSAETICVVNDKAYFLARDGFYRTFVIYDDKRVLAENPALSIEACENDKKGRYYVSVPEKSLLVDFSDAKSVRRLSSISNRLSSFVEHRMDSDLGKKYTALLSVVVDYPRNDVQNAGAIRKWLKGKVPGLKSMMADFGEDLDSCPFTLFSVYNLRARVMNSRFVTYQEYTHDYLGGAHGFYTASLVSYDHVHQQEIDYNYLFGGKHKQQILDMIQEEVMKSPRYDYWVPDVDMFAYENDREGNRTGFINLPQLGLSEEGVVFSFQPYDICCFAAGCFHFTIPYHKVRKYLTPRGKWCLGLQ